ncbi:hypothetical protein GCM10011494_24590 [Novosphingobium endophyticum]|uniref:Tyr recombinase domain-containing protein n=1 Tax=Novosphingobium endophyticum TaxID=1955250 RepID=A0A916TUC5_9SPHN|nr:tyrosine-type recombinase/integrase [Novosphingobium endophyticum]GGC05088.1 hypothetical protein GCM10011494_24590 [Novosphingobium endophyticum]
MDLSTVKERDNLKARREPHWQRLSPGRYLGYRPSAREGAGTWIARAYDEDYRKYRFKRLGDFAALPSRKQFAAAKKEAEAFADLVESGGAAQKKIQTVADACRDYLTAISDDHRIAEGVFRRHVYSDLLANVKLDKLRRHHLREWRRRLEEAPAVISRRKKGEQRTRARAKSTINRDMAPLRAALNKFLAHGKPGTDAAWQEALQPFRNANRRRLLYLDKDQRRSLLEHVDAEAAPFVRALCLLPLRPGAMAALTVGDFDKRTSELTTGTDKTGNVRRFVISPVAAALFAEQASDQIATVPLFRRANGDAWNRNTWGDAIESAAKAADLPDNTTAYTLRHSTITDLVREGLPLLTIGQISGTSVEMIEWHYSHLARDAAVKALGKLAL